MRNAALISLLPCLATLATAHPRPSHDIRSVRKSLNFGPKHEHATFQVVAAAHDEGLTKRGFTDELDAQIAARQFLDRQVGAEGESYYIRKDSYTDARTGVTHIYAKQLIDGLEVSDGDINLNIDRYGNIISWGNSFHPGTKAQTSPSGETCAMMNDQLDAYRSEAGENAWGLVKSAAQVLLPSLGRHHHTVDPRIQANIQHVSHHIEALCDQPQKEVLTPVDALIALLPRISASSSSSVDFADDLVATPEHSFAPKPAPAEPPTQIISGSGLAKAGIKSHVPARLMYTQVTDGAPRSVWKLEVELESNWYEAYVDVQTGELLRIVDWAKDYSWTSDGPAPSKEHKQKPLPAPPKKLEPYTYQVFPWGINDPTSGNLSIVTKPWDTTASPAGWHEFPSASNPWAGSKIPGMNTTGNTTHFYTTAGNNVIAHEDWEGQNNYLLNYRPINESLTFVYDYGEPDGLAPREYIDFVITQLFYTSNMYHDLTYRLGFDELAGNFQAHNFGKGGNGGDPVIANAQDGSGMNNANFMTPPDGTSGRMRMYVWDTATPYRDGDIEAGIIIHELSHGLSTRLTGGPMNSGCLGFGEAGGMGEGWGDAIATLIRQIEEHKSFSNGTDVYSMGSWAANRELGIRHYKYSTDEAVNPSTYKILDKPAYWGVHAIGEVWAEMLFIMSQRLVEKYGFSSTLFPPIDTSIPNDYYVNTASVDAKGKPTPLVPKHGNTLALQLILDGMKLQPCRPSFFDARDAIIQADLMLTGGENACLIWKAFAERGLGIDAGIINKSPWGPGIRTDGFKIPSKVCKEHK
ncbi:putative extracellular elastinolytic metallo proteinase precursor [Kockovaella imperatae]|uniref:Extracellular metalloproteinase n=1 Tax=Kockovaella imperatae TaxID=4999 RepID=A0A1Y1U8W0_9TREE|nr:putative extracellular elastinolytic metallo proteinase precursor [Kockovaella imperatae]ORX33984.1 putative extracellular elastinolytic metallo proteinase precursor [Kockovaella imperatae]